VKTEGIRPGGWRRVPSKERLSSCVEY
jgi:hypothetical protein